MKHFLIVITFLTTCFSYSQTDDVLAKSYYSKAEKEFENKNYSNSIKMLDKAKEYLKGKTFSKVEYLYVMSHYKLRNYVKANVHMRKYFDLNPSENSSMYSEIVSIAADVKTIATEKIEKAKKNKEERLKIYGKTISGFGKIIKHNNKYGVIDLKGNELLPFIYDKITFENKDFIKVKKGSYFGVIDSKNKTIIPFNYKAIRINKKYVELCSEKYNSDTNKCRLYFFKTKKISPYTFNDTDGESDKYLIVDKSSYRGDVGLVSKITGKIIIPFINRYIAYAKPFWIVKKETEVISLLDENLKVLIPSGKYMSIDYNEGDRFIKVKDMAYWWTLLDKNLNRVSEYFVSIGPFYDGYAKVKKNDRFGYIDINGNVVVPVKYKYKNTKKMKEALRKIKN